MKNYFPAFLLLIGCFFLFSNSNPRETTVTFPLYGPQQAPANQEGKVQVSGILGQAISANRQGRIKQLIVDERSSFIRIFSVDSAKRNLDKNWMGEHAGKWLYAASKAAFQSQDTALIRSLRKVASFLIKQQAPDGYLGTYAPSIRMTALLNSGKNIQTWDVWVHGYLIEGLLELNRYFPDPGYVQACEKIGDLFINVFQKGGVNMANASYHTGLAGTGSVGPMVELYRTTGKQKYLDFAKYCVVQMEIRPGLNLITRCFKEYDASLIGNGKMYEMLRTLVGVAKLYQVTGQDNYLQACKNIWQNIHDIHLTPAGGPWGGIDKHPEMFNREYVFSPYGNNETCATMDWLRFNNELLNSTGEGKYAEEIEKTTYNALLGAQFPDGLSWVYHSHVNGLREKCGVDACCSSSGTLSLEEIPAIICTKKDNGIAINLFTESSSVVVLAKAGNVSIQQRTLYPFNGKINVIVTPETSTTFPLFIRLPEWTDKAEIKVNGKPQQLISKPNEYARLERKWSKGDEIEIQFPFAFRAMFRTMAYNEKGDYLDKETRYMALSRGPLVYSTAYADELKKPANLIFDPQLINQLKPYPAKSKLLSPLFQLDWKGQKFILSPYYSVGNRADKISRMTWLRLN